MAEPREQGAFAIGLAVALALWPCIGRAQSSGDEPLDEQTRALFREGAQHYNLGEFEQALNAFERAYELSRRPNLLFNIAQAHRLQGPTHCRQALDFYQRYLREVPDAANRDEVQERILQLQVCERTPPAPREAVVAPPPPAPVSRQGPLRVLWGSGFAVAAGAAVYGTSSYELNAARAVCGACSGQVNNWRTAQTVSYGLMGAGVAGLIFGIAWATTR